MLSPPAAQGFPIEVTLSIMATATRDLSEQGIRQGRSRAAKTREGRRCAKGTDENGMEEKESGPF